MFKFILGLLLGLFIGAGREKVEKFINWLRDLFGSSQYKYIEGVKIKYPFGEVSNDEVYEMLAGDPEVKDIDSDRGPSVEFVPPCGYAIGKMFTEVLPEYNLSLEDFACTRIFRVNGLTPLLLASQDQK